MNNVVNLEGGSVLAAPTSGANYQAAVRKRAQAWIDAGKSAGRSMQTIALGIGMSRNTVSFFLAGTYGTGRIGGDADGVARKIEEFLNHEELGEALRVRLNPVETPTFKTVCTILDTVKYSGDLGVIVGPPGCGKTFAAEWYAAQDPQRNLLLHAHHGMAAPKGFSAVLRHALTGEEKVRYGFVERMIAECAESLQRRPRFIVINDAHRCNFGVLDLACYLSEVACVGFAFIGHEALKSSINGEAERDREGFDRVDDRAVYGNVGHDADFESILQVARQILPGVTDDAVDLLADRAVCPSMRSVVIACKIARRALKSPSDAADRRLLARAVKTKNGGK